jgi:hypothetical protein
MVVFIPGGVLTENITKMTINKKGVFLHDDLAADGIHLVSL